MVAFVADNSVVLSWFYPKQATEYTERLLTLADRAEVHTAFVWPAEFANANLTLLRRKLIDAVQSQEILKAVAGFGFITHAAPESLARLIDLGHDYGLSAYDAAYLELAQRLALPLATRDIALRKAAKALNLDLE